MGYSTPIRLQDYVAVRSSLMALARANGVRKGVVKLRPIKPALAHKRELRGIINEMVAMVYSHASHLIAALPAPQPGITDSADDIDRLLALIVTQTQQVMTRLEIKVKNWSGKVNERQKSLFIESLFAATKIHADTILSPTDSLKTVDHYVTWATSLIRDVGEEGRRKIGNAVLEAVRNNTAPRELAKTIQGFEDMSYRRAKNIASDQTTKLYAALNEARQKEVGITHFTWIHSGSPHPREWHVERDGQLFAWDDPEIDAGDFPGEPPFCGCSAQATIVDESGNEVDTGEEDVPVEGE